MTSLTLEEQKLILNGKKLPDDVSIDDVIFLVSYPKSGNTWLRFLIGNYLTKNKFDFTNHHQIIPEIYDPRNLIENIKIRPVFIKSHEPYTPFYKKVIYIVRHGMDVAVSQYHHCLKHRTIDPNMTFDEFIFRFNYGSINPFHRLIGTWSNHVQGWVDHDSSNCLLLTYEGLKNKTIEELRKVLIFAGIDPNEEDLNNAVLASQFENMQKLEIEQCKEGIVPNSDPLFMGSDTSMNFVRKGKVGESKDWFNQAQINSFFQFHGSALIRFGYLSEKEYPKLLQETQSQLQKNQFQLEETSAKYKATEISLEETQSQLEETSAKLRASEIRLQETQSQLQQTELKLQETRQIISGMESSKFWKMRQFWFKIKSKLFK